MRAFYTINEITSSIDVAINTSHIVKMEEVTNVPLPDGGKVSTVFYLTDGSILKASRSLSYHFEQMERGG